MSTITEKGAANNIKDAKNICAFRILLRIKELEGTNPGALVPKDKKSKKM